MSNDVGRDNDMDSSMAAGMFAVFFEAKKGTARAQWFLFPPSLEELGSHQKEGAGRFIKRRWETHNERAKWSTTEKPSFSLLSHKIALELDQYASTGWEILLPVVIQLEADDYEKVWAMVGKVDTPYKALRAVERVTVRRGYRLVDEA